MDFYLALVLIAMWVFYEDTGSWHAPFFIFIALILFPLLLAAVF